MKPVLCQSLTAGRESCDEANFHSGSQFQKRAYRQPSEQRKIIECNFHVCLALACMPHTEMERYFSRRPYVATHQDLEQYLESLWLQGDAGDACTPHDKESGKRILHANRTVQQWHCHPGAQQRNNSSHGVPACGPVLLGVAATNCNVVSAIDSLNQLRQKLRWVL